MERALATEAGPQNAEQSRRPPAPAAALQLSRAIGNRAFCHLLARDELQPGGTRPTPAPAAALQLSRAIGNRAFCHLLARDELQPGDTRPTDAIDRAAGGRARYNPRYGRQCQPYATTWEARAVQAEMVVLVPNGVNVELVRRSPSWAPVDAATAWEVSVIWQQYLTGGAGGGRIVRDGIANPSDRIARAFANDVRHEPHEDAVLEWAREHMRSRLAGRGIVTLTLDELSAAGMPFSLRRPNPNYDSHAYTVAANLAGGLGDMLTPDSDFGPDYRVLDGTVTLDSRPARDNRLWASVGVRGTFDWSVYDAIDFCPGNAGGSFQELATIPMSRLEASGIARDIGLLIKFRRVRGLPPREYPNPDHEFPPPPLPPQPAPPVHVVPADALFRFDSAELTPRARRRLRERLGTAPDRADISHPIEVGGHTDNVPGPDRGYNDRLSLDRAIAVQRALEEMYPRLRGHLVPRGYGAGRPIADNAHHDGRARNRRVEIQLTEPGAR